MAATSADLGAPQRCRSSAGSQTLRTGPATTRAKTTTAAGQAEIVQEESGNAEACACQPDRPGGGVGLGQGGDLPTIVQCATGAGDRRAVDVGLGRAVAQQR